MRHYFILSVCLFASATGASVPAFAEGEDTFVISANRRAVPLREVGGSISVVTGEELEAQGITFVEEALRRLPGVQASASGGPGGQVAVRLRGEEAYRTLVLIDGIRVSDASLPQAAVNFGNLSVAGIERIEVLRGPQALLYGADAIGGVINIVTRRGGEAEATLYGEYGSWETTRLGAYAGTSTDQFDIALSGESFRWDGFSAKSDPTVSDDDGYRNLTLHGVAGLQLGDGTRLEAVGRYVDAYTQFDGFSFDPDRQMDTREWAGRLALTTDQLGGGITHTLAYNHYRSERDDYDGGVPTVDFFSAPISIFDGERQEGEYIGFFEPVEGHGFTFGGEVEREEVTTDSISSETSTFAAFAEWQAEWSDRFFTTAGLRFDAPDDFDDHVSLRGTAAYLVPLFGGEETKFRASLGTGFRAPSAYEQATNAAALLPALHEETAFGFDIGIDQPLPNGRGQVSVTYFNQHIEDEIRFDNVGFTGYFQANGESESQGIEVLLEVELAEGLTLSSQYTYTDATVNSPDAEDGLQRVRRPTHLTSTDLDYVTLGGRLQLNANVRTSADQEDGFLNFRTPLDDYVAAGLAGSYQVTDCLELTARVTNLFDEKYSEVAGFNTAGRAAYIGARVRF